MDPEITQLGSSRVGIQTLMVWLPILFLRVNAFQYLNTVISSRMDTAL